MSEIFSREVPWLSDPRALARSLSRFESWAWLDGAGDASGVLSADRETRCSYFAVSASVRTAVRGEERAFLDALCEELPGSTRGAGFQGGWITAFAYEFGVSLAGLPPAPDTVAPAFALRITEVLELDHRSQRATLYGASESALDEWWITHGAAWDVLVPAEVTHPTLPVPTPDLHGTTGSPWHATAGAYRNQVVACQAAIADGEAYVLCLTDQANTYTAQHPLDLYLALRDARVSLRGAVVVTLHRALVSASPERFLSLHGSQLCTHPIKGTRPRVSDPELDAALAAELAADPKERAENLMIVDLMRNDLNRVCEPGSVVTADFLQVETHPYVHQLVSTVTGTLREHVTLSDVLTATFPGGSMTGAPKHRAIEILAELERAPRGLYSGCFGWISAGSHGQPELELAMTIRSIELRAEPDANGENSYTARVGAGGGITADSVPEREHAERILKAQPLLAVIGH